MPDTRFRVKALLISTSLYLRVKSSRGNHHSSPRAEPTACKAVKFNDLTVQLVVLFRQVIETAICLVSGLESHWMIQLELHLQRIGNSNSIR